jgi:hypothetical protein
VIAHVARGHVEGVQGGVVVWSGIAGQPLLLPAVGVHGVDLWIRPFRRHSLVQRTKASRLPTLLCPKRNLILGA